MPDIIERNKKCAQQLLEAADTIARLMDRIAQLETALEPFSNYGNKFLDGANNVLYPDPCPIRATPANGRESGVSPTVGDCRAAASTMQR